ncbi:glycerate kinase type-2 family protein [Foetidibacter luteolus]|uniref:glycerate kinase type-2 family protein n=1 Tax=Foetidibacter luteolus TaxID=2608880 RepID=UPI00129B864B|nr:DUF4147 domain-containing protein [Foetidibacter luteolus]
MKSLNDAIEIFNAAVKAVQPAVLIPQQLSVKDNHLLLPGGTWPLDKGKIYLLSVGKAASAMAQEAEKILGSHITKGLVVTKYHHSLPVKFCTTIEAGHPVPDENSIKAAEAIKGFLQNLAGSDLLLCFISGGASALIADIAEGISLADLQQLSRLLLQCGASIHEINTIRKHTSTLKGGQLLRYANGARVAAFLISDVMGDDTSVIASGLTVADKSTFADAWKIVKQYNLEEKLPHAVAAHLRKGLNAEITETPKPGDDCFANTINSIIASNSIALGAAAGTARKLGYNVSIINAAIDGEARQRAAEFVNELLHYEAAKPACLLMGGETTVTIRGKGKGGRNQEFVLAALQELIQQQVTADKLPVVLSGGTDGTDGPTDAAGAVIDNSIMPLLASLQLDPLPYLRNNDAYHFFQQTSNLLITGPTQTNVMDVVVGLVG